MKILIASDIHGSELCAKILVDTLKKEADQMILLGDIYYHGPRNPLPECYFPQGVANQLNAVSNKLLVVKGNCDSNVDTLISNFDFMEHLMLVVDGKKIFLTHGDKYSINDMPKTDVDLLIYGHYHTGFIKRAENGALVANAGSVSLPKENTKPSYILLDTEKKTIELKELTGEIIATASF